MTFVRERNGLSNSLGAPTSGHAAGSRDRGLRGMTYDEGVAALSPSASVQLSPTEGTPSFAEVAAGHARAMDEKQSKQIDETGEGDYTGSQSGEAGKAKTSCDKSQEAYLVTDAKFSEFSVSWPSDFD